MPIIKSAKKALRQTKKRTEKNLFKKNVLKSEIKKAKDKKDPSVLGRLHSLVDKAVKSGIIHKNKASRIKSRFSRLLTNKKN